MKENTTYRIARHTADQTMTPSSSTLQDVDSLAVSLEASKTYKYKVSYLVIGKNTESISVAVVGPTSPTLHTYGLESVSPKVTTDATKINITLSDDTDSVIVVEGVIQNGTTAGNLKAQACQETGGATTLKVLKGSSMEVWQISDTT